MSRTWLMALVPGLLACGGERAEELLACTADSGCQVWCAARAPSAEASCRGGVCICTVTPGGVLGGDGASPAEDAGRTVPADGSAEPSDAGRVAASDAEGGGRVVRDALAQSDGESEPDGVGRDISAPEVIVTDSGPPAVAPCPANMALVGEAVCMDRYEAPNQPGGLPFVMFTFDESASWCQARGKRLCFDDEWTLACAGPDGLAYPYGDAHAPGVCNDDKVWKVYSQSALSGWPYGLALDSVETLTELLALAAAASPAASEAASHTESLYQATGGGDKEGCGGSYGVYDLVGNVEEWTRRKDGGAPQFHGNLKGRYWAEPRTCQQGVTSHGDAFRFYEIGFRCCTEPAP